MVNIITQLFKYLFAILMTVYTIRCFTNFLLKSDRRRKGAYRGQNSLMFIIHFMLNIIIYLNDPSVMVIIFYIAQVCFFIAALFLYSHMYKNASLMLINNMFFFMMIGFAMLTRLEFSLAVKQFMIAVASVALSLVVPVIVEKAGFLSRLGIVYGILGLGLVGSVFVFGRSVYGAINWVSIAGIGFQPSEIAKIVFVFFVASMLYKNTDFTRIVLTTGVAAVFVLILVAEKDLGAAVIFFVTYIVMLYVATRKFIWTGLGLGLGSAAAVLAYAVFPHVRRRVVAWRDPWSNYNDAGYQICQSMFAIATGGWFGMGFYKGAPHDIPVVESDFIFSMISEEMGGFFAICLLMIFFSCFIMFIYISLKLTNNFYKLLAIGLCVSFGIQVFLCVGGVIKFIPHTGVTLPLISYGGSSVLSTILVFAVIQGLYLLRRKELGTNVGGQ